MSIAHPGGGRTFVVILYRVNGDLPPPVEDHLPKHAQDIY